VERRGGEKPGKAVGLVGGGGDMPPHPSQEREKYLALCIHVTGTKNNIIQCRSIQTSLYLNIEWKLCNFDSKTKRSLK